VKAPLVVIVALALAACGSTSSKTTTNAANGVGAGATSATASSTTTTTSATAPASASGTATAPAASSTAGAVTTVPASPTASATTTTTTTGTATTRTSTSSTTAVAGPALCRAPALAISFLGQQGATGHGELGFALRNKTSVACTTVGYPGVLFLARDGSPLPTLPAHTTEDFFGTAPLRQLHVAPGGVVSFRLGVTHGIASTAGCTTAYGLQVIAPNDTATLRVSIPDGAFECRGATVSPLQAGDSAYP